VEEGRRLTRKLKMSQVPAISGNTIAFGRRNY
jgi:hypothetical protein